MWAEVLPDTTKGGTTTRCVVTAATRYCHVHQAVTVTVAMALFQYMEIQQTSIRSNGHYDPHSGPSHSLSGHVRKTRTRISGIAFSKPETRVLKQNQQNPGFTNLS